MHPSTLFLFRILLVAGGLILIYIIGKPVVETIQYRVQGSVVQGKVIGFRGSRTSKTIFEDNTATYRKKHRPRRPVFRYPRSAGSIDSIDGYATTTIMVPWLNFDLGENITVVMSKNDASKAHIYSYGIFFTNVLLLFFCSYMIKLGFTRIKT
jgi:hypothetical protein